MGKTEIIKFLEGNPNQWFSAAEITNHTKTNSASTYNTIKRLLKDGVIISKTLQTVTSGGPKKVYTAVRKDTDFEQAVHEYRELRRAYNDILHSDLIGSLMIVAKINKLERIINGKQN